MALMDELAGDSWEIIALREEVRRLLASQAYAAWTIGWLEAARGNGALGIEACRRSLEHSLIS
jgi:hypothetical protein